MNQLLSRGGFPLLAIVALTGCVDDNYDLSDIDTTSEFKVKDLVLPINIDPITLGDIIEIKEGDQIKEFTLNGKTFYAIQEQGDFKSDPIVIPGFNVDAPTLSPSSLEFKAASSVSSIPAKAAENSISFALQNPIIRDFAYSATNIDPSIVQVTDIFADLRISIKFDVDAAITNMADIELADLRLTLPKGLEIATVSPDGNYEPGNGELTIPSVQFVNGEAEIALNATKINISINESGINDRTLVLNTNVNIEEAELNITPKSDSGMSVPNDMSVNVSYDISPLNVKAVSGEIQYKLEGDGLNISPISLASVPDFLSGDGTNLILSNPQIYLQVNNPLADYELTYQTGIAITPVRDGKESDPYTLDEGSFSVGYNNGINGPYNFCLSPVEPIDIPDSFAENFNHVDFTSLSYVVSGNGIPDEVEINLVDPQVPTQKVEKFELDKDLVALNGEWEFIAPLAMKAGTEAKIIYTDDVDGWNDEDIDAITIQTLEVSMNVTNDTPLMAELTGYPIDVNGKQISGVEITGANIPGDAKDTPVTIKITGEVKHLDGIRFVATVIPSSDNPISPSQSITLSNIRAKVSGNYNKEF